MLAGGRHAHSLGRTVHGIRCLPCDKPLQLPNRVVRTTVCAAVWGGAQVVSNVVDEDFVRYQRHRTMASMIFGTNALLTKPAQSLAPLVRHVGQPSRSPRAVVSCLLVG